MDTNGDAPDGDDESSTEDIALAHRYRWRLLYCLFRYTNPVYLPDIAHQLAIWEPSDREIDFLQHRLTVYNALYHDHLPELEDADIVTYYDQTDEVELGPAAERIKPALIKQLRSEIGGLLAAERSRMEGPASEE
ncbi:MAG: hypothetical protein ACI8U4_000427 [Natronomonas sp.]|jgi:hypothetical protein